MARGKKSLTPAQAAALKIVSDVDNAWRNRKKTINVEAEMWKVQQMGELTAQRDQAVLRAVHVGVPKVVISAQGLLASPNAVYEIMKAHASLPGALGNILTPLARYAIGATHYPAGQTLDDIRSVVWVEDGHNPTETSSAPMNGEVLTHEGQRYMVRYHTGAMQNKLLNHAQIDIHPKPPADAIELNALLTEFGDSLWERYSKHLQETRDASAGLVVLPPEMGDMVESGSYDEDTVPPAPEGWVDDYVGEIGDGDE